MKMMNTIVATIAIVVSTATTVQARDSFSIGINVGGHGYARHSIGTHRYAPALRRHYGAPIVYYSTRPVVYYAPAIRYNSFHPFISFNRHISRDSHRRGYMRRDFSRRGERHHHRRGDDRRYGGRR